MTEQQKKQALYELTDSFLVEAKDQNGNERSIKRLNQDRHLFVENAMKLLEQVEQQATERTKEECVEIIKSCCETSDIITIGDIIGEIQGDFMEPWQKALSSQKEEV